MVIFKHTKDLSGDMLNRDEKFLNKIKEFNNPSIRKKYDDGKIMRIGNVSTGKSQAGMVYRIDGISQTICACTHWYAFGYIYDDRRKE